MDTDKKAKTASPPPGTLIYLGPTFRQPVLLMYGSVFRGGLPKHFGELFADPDVKACFLPLDKAGEALRGMREKQGFFTTHERVKRNHIKG
ncbi:hypothetical protein [Bilophila wadsworthia]|uniref:hypothetical protein n=1 Tax=Bilophila wadsworthia TaxID=35833 RepID=UPI00243245CF|nr:hypothetical protein [Bilophila wadsworthia]